MAQAPGVKVVRPHQKRGPIPIAAADQGDVLVGRIHKELSDPSGHPISMFVAADQLLKGAALNAMQIAGLLLDLSSGARRDDRSKPGWPKPRLTGNPPACSTSRVLLITATGTRALLHSCQHLHPFGDHSVLHTPCGGFYRAISHVRYRASGSARVLHPAVVAAVADAAGFRSTDIAQPRNVRITGGPSVNISIVTAPRATSQRRSGRQRPGAQRQSQSTHRRSAFEV